MRLKSARGTADSEHMKSRIWLMVLAMIATLIATLIAPSQVLQAAEPQAQPVSLQDLMEEIRHLKARVVELEARQSDFHLKATQQINAALSETAANEGFVNKPAQEPDPAVAPPEDHSSHHGGSLLFSPTLSFHGYADLGYRAINQAGGANTFCLGQADLFLTSKLSAHLSFLMVSQILGSAGHRRAITAGYRNDLAEFCAIKVQLERVAKRLLPATIEGSGQLSFAS